MPGVWRGETPRRATRCSRWHKQGLPEAGRPVLVALRRALQEAVPGAASEVASGDLMNLDCRLAAALDRQTGALDEVLRCGGGRVPEARRLALGLREVAQTKGRGGASGAVQYLSHPDSRVRLAALEAVAARPVPEATGPVRTLIKGEANGEDLVEAGAAASTAGKLKDVEALPRVRVLAERVSQEPDLIASGGGGAGGAGGEGGGAGTAEVAGASARQRAPGGGRVPLGPDWPA